MVSPSSWPTCRTTDRARTGDRFVSVDVQITNRAPTSSHFLAARVSSSDAQEQYDETAFGGLSPGAPDGDRGHAEYPWLRCVPGADRHHWSQSAVTGQHHISGGGARAQLGAIMRVGPADRSEDDLELLGPVGVDFGGSDQHTHPGCSNSQHFPHLGSSDTDDVTGHKIGWRHNGLLMGQQHTQCPITPPDLDHTGCTSVPEGRSRSSKLPVTPPGWPPLDPLSSCHRRPVCPLTCVRTSSDKPRAPGMCAPVPVGGSSNLPARIGLPHGRPGR
jgi:hypothetical protein